MSIQKERLLKVICAPIVSEKSTRVRETENGVVFEVVKDATKAEIKAAVEYLFEVQVDTVRTLRVKGKLKRRGKTQGFQKNWKKAYVTLIKGQELDPVQTLSEATGAV